MTIKNFYNLLDQLYPINSQEEWDNCGLIEFDSSQSVTNPTLALDLSSEVVEFAIKKNSNLIITHHPIYIDESDLKLKHIKWILQKLANYKICTIALHTCFDKNKFGTSYQIIKNLRGFKIWQSKKSLFLFFGVSKTKINFATLVKKLKINLDLEYVNLFVKDEKAINWNQKKHLKIAVVGGSGCSEIASILKKDKIDFFITSEVKWHLWNKNNSDYFKILEVPHSIEKIFIKTIKSKFKAITFLEFLPNKILSL